MSGFLIGRTSCTPQQASVLTDSVLNMLVTDMRPLSMVEDDGFRTMIHTFYPGYTLPSRTHFTRLMERKYEQTFNAVKTALNNGNNSKLALTTDVWTSVAIQAYLGVTCHYITDDWEMKSICLTTMPLQDRHTGSNIAEWLEEVVARFEIPPSNIIAVVHDNGANVVAAARILEEKNGWSSVRCTGHTLQLVINAALKHPSIEKAIGAARCLVEHFKKSELASGKLRAKQQMATPEHSLVQDVSTRWNSTFYMVSRLIEQRWPVTATLSDISVTQKGKRYLDLKPEQWILLEELLKALKPFECATVFMSAEKYTTISAIPPLVKGLLMSTESAAYESGPLHAFQVTATNQLQGRWKRETTFSDTAANTVILASAFDPRFRKLKFLSPEEILCVQNKVQRLALGEMERNLQQPDTSSDTASASTPPTTLLDSLLGSSSEEGDGSSGDDDVNTKVREEVLRYFEEKKLSKEENPLQWWKNNMDKYPIMARLAKSYLCIPGTSTPSERLFSAAGNMTSKKRASLSKEHVDMLTFLHCNAKFMPKTVN